MAEPESALITEPVELTEHERELVRRYRQSQQQGNLNARLLAAIEENAAKHRRLAEHLFSKPGKRNG
jgi:hypothetical protein